MVKNKLKLMEMIGVREDIAKSFPKSLLIEKKEGVELNRDKISVMSRSDASHYNMTSCEAEKFIKKIEPKKIKEIVIANNDEIALRRGLIDFYHKNSKKVNIGCFIRTARITLEDNTVIQINGLLCGYRGTEPEISADVLAYLGVPEDMIENVYTNPYCQYTYNGSNWSFNECYGLELNKYGNVKGIPNGWIETTLTVAQLKKLNIPTYKACIGFNNNGYGYYKPIIENIIPIDYEEMADNYLFEKRNKKIRKEMKNKDIAKNVTPDILGTCLYVINKEAKYHRDRQEELYNKISEYNFIRQCNYYGYDDDDYDYDDCISMGYSSSSIYAKREALDHHRNIKLRMYELKEKAIKKAIEEWKLEPVGYHTFSDMNRDMYVIGGFEFHINENKSDIHIGDIEDEIPAEKTKRLMSIEKATSILENYINQ